MSLDNVIDFYVIRARLTCFFKVGISAEPENRLRDLQIGCPLKLEFYLREPMAKRRAQETETMLKCGLRPFQAEGGGEWYLLEERELDNWLHAQGIKWREVIA